jgi:hypothetical protein
MPGERDHDEVKEQAGVLLPGVDPAIGEIVVAAFFANGHALVGEVIAGLILGAPKEMAAEIAGACFELVLCREKGQLRWLDVKAQDILVGIRTAPGSKSICFGTEAHWPMEALLAGPPKSAIVRLPQGARRVFLACEGLKGAVIRQSEAVALGNAMIESFGGKIIEDRLGPETMQQSFIESNMTARAKLRAQATSQVEKMTVERRSAGIKHGFNRISMAEAAPGTCRPGMVLHPEGVLGPLYEVERRVNESWVILIAKEAGAAGNIRDGAAWVGDGDFAGGPFMPAGADNSFLVVINQGAVSPHWGFTDQGAISDEPALSLVEEGDDGQAATTDDPPTE